MRKRTRNVLLKVATVGAISACANLEVGTAPQPPVGPITRTALEQATKGARVKVLVPKELREIGCIAVGSVNGQSKVASLGRSSVAHLVGPLDSIDAPIIDGKAGRGTLHVVSGLVSIPGYSNNFSVHCLAPMSLRQNVFIDKLAGGAGKVVPQLVANNLRGHPNAEGKSNGVLASDLLLATIRSGSPRLFLPSGEAPRSIGQTVNLRPRYDLICGPGTEFACGAPTLPTVTVTARPNWPIVVDITEIYRDYRVYSLSALFGVFFYDGPDCTNASEAWIALNEEITQMEDIASEMEMATAAVANLACESELTEGGHYVCFDLFIMSERAGFFVGDDRTHDPNAPYKASRAQIYINPSTCSVSWVVNTTRTVSWGPIEPGTHAPHKLNRVQAYRNDEAQCVVEWSLLNGWCQSGGLGPLCPAINGRLIFKGNADGTWNANVKEDLFPSRGLYRWNGSSFEVIDERTETTALDLVSWRQKIQDLKIARDNAMPPGCHLE